MEETRRIGNGVKDIKKFRRQYANHPASSLLSSALFRSDRFFRSFFRESACRCPRQSESILFIGQAASLNRRVSPTRMLGRCI